MDYKQKAKDLLELLKSQRKYQLGAAVIFCMIMFLVLSDGKPPRRAPLKAHKPVEKNLTETLGRKEAYDDLIEAFKTDMESVKSDIESGDIGYIRISSFTEQTQEGIDKAMAERVKLGLPASPTKEHP